MDTETTRDKRTKPILKWAGGKSGVLSQLTPFFPKQFKRYFEPFFGSGAVFFALEPNDSAYLNDSNSEIINLYETVREMPKLVMECLDKLALQYSEDFYYKLRSRIPSDRVDIAARTIFLNKVGFNGLYRQNSQGLFNVPFGKRIKCPALYDAVNLTRVSQALQNAVLSSEDFESVLERARQGDFVYCDPPYEPLSRTSSFNKYQGTGFSRLDQTRLKEACMRAHKRGATVVVSNSSAEFILELYAGFDVRRVSARRAINSKGESRGVVDEVFVVMGGF